MVLASIFDQKQTAAFKATYEKAQHEADHAARIKMFKGAALKFAEGAAKAVGASVGLALKAHLGIP